MASYSWSTAHAGSAPNSLTMAGHNPFRDPTLGEKIVALVLAAWLLMTTYAFVALRRRWRAGGGFALLPSIVKRFRRTPKQWRIGVLACATVVLLLWSSRFLWPQERGLWRDNMRGWSGLVVSSNPPVAGFLAPAYWEIVIIDDSTHRRVTRYRKVAPPALDAGDHVVKLPGYGSQLCVPAHVKFPCDGDLAKTLVTKRSRPTGKEPPPQSLRTDWRDHRIQRSRCARPRSLLQYYGVVGTCALRASSHRL